MRRVGHVCDRQIFNPLRRAPHMRIAFDQKPVDK
jgi:hypothetical protein